MSEATCSVPTCSNAGPLTRGWCSTHYKRWQAGDVKADVPVASRKLVDLAGQRFGMLVVLAYQGRQKWLCQCDCGAATAAYGWNLTGGGTKRCGDRAVHRRDEEPTYKAVHLRLTADRGRAKDHLCIDCGEQALHWSYDQRDPSERWGSNGRGTQPMPYSTDLAHYVPRCNPCHTRFDKEAAKARQRMDA